MARRVRLRAQLEEIARRAIGRVEAGRLVQAALACASPYGARQAGVTVDRNSCGIAHCFGSTRVWAVGKAAARMALGAQAALGDLVAGGLVIARAPEPRPPALDARLDFVAAAHPFPDERSVRAAHALAGEAAHVAPNGRALLLLSGGASSLIGAPIAGLELATLAATTRALLDGGAPIGEINVVRRHLGLLQGGRLARACAGSLEVLALSDVIGDDPAAIGSGPASPDPSTLDEAQAIARRYRVPAAALDALDRAEETPKPGDPIFARVRYRILAGPGALRDAVGREAEDAGFTVEVRDELVTGPVETLAEEIEARARALEPGHAWVAAGEPTIEIPGEVRGVGLGGRAQHLALRIARAIAGSELAFVACGSDGSDGPTPAAGASVDGETWTGEGDRALARFDSHSFLHARGAAIVTGPTGTNLTDLFVLARAATREMRSA